MTITTKTIEIYFKFIYIYLVLITGNGCILQCNYNSQHATHVVSVFDIRYKFGLFTGVLQNVSREPHIYSHYTEYRNLLTSLFTCKGSRKLRPYMRESPVTRIGQHSGL